VSLYDTRFFFEHYYSSDPATLRKTTDELAGRGPRFVSSVTVHEFYKLILEKEGRDVAKLRVGLMVKEFTVIPLDAELAVLSAEIRSRHRIPMADSIILATAKMHRLDCVTDDPHLVRVREAKTRWLR
jgi:predicted nucleic acid-binding protein